VIQIYGGSEKKQIKRGGIDLSPFSGLEIAASLALLAKTEDGTVIGRIIN